MTILEKALTTMQQLSTDQQVQALRFIEFLAFEGGDRQVLKSNQDTPVNDESIVLAMT
jgi:hypothetical protein